jgi:hypothetical protein
MQRERKRAWGTAALILKGVGGGERNGGGGGPTLGAPRGGRAGDLARCGMWRDGGRGPASVAHGSDGDGQRSSGTGGRGVGKRGH